MTKGFDSVATPSRAGACVKKLVVKGANRAHGKVAPTCTKGPALLCNDLEDMLQPKSHSFRGMLVERPQDETEFQQHVDTLANSDALNREMSVQEEICQLGQKSKNALAEEISKKAQSIVSFVVEHGLPEELGCQLQQDFEQIGTVMTKLVPTAKCLQLKLDIMGENGCCRWHRDNYIGRAVVTYNATGTEFVHHDHVNLSQLGKSGSPNKVIVPDTTKILAAGVGDILFMKGLKYPGEANGLVHRSPEKLYHEDNRIKNRLLLKVDLL